MKRNAFLFSIQIFIIVFFVSYSNFSQAQSFSKSKLVEKKYNVSMSSTVEINNKYGKIHIVPYRADEIKFIIEIIAESKDSLKLDKILKSVNFDINPSDFFISFKTTIGNNEDSFFSGFEEITEAFLENESELEINYMVYVPTYVNLKLMNKYGDIYIDDFTGNINIDLANGSLDAGKLSGEVKVIHKFGKAKINSVNTAHFNISYGELKIEQSRQANIISKSSTISIKKADVLKINSKRDKYFITSSKYIFGKTYFSNISTQNLLLEAKIESKYGDFIIDNIAKNYSFIQLKSKYTDIFLHFSPNSSCKMQIVKQGGTLNVPKVSESKGNSKEFFEATFGKKRLNKTSLKIISNNSKIKITK